MLDIQAIHKTFNAGTVNEKAALRGGVPPPGRGGFRHRHRRQRRRQVHSAQHGGGHLLPRRGVHHHRRGGRHPAAEHKRAKYIGRVFQDPMTGTAATMQIEENLALAKRRGQPPHPAPGHHPGRAGGVPGAAEDPGPGPGGPADGKGGPALRRPAPGPHPAHGQPGEAQAAPAG